MLKKFVEFRLVSCLWQETVPLDGKLPCGRRFGRDAEIYFISKVG
jgi:hypothetical protein